MQVAEPVHEPSPSSRRASGPTGSGLPSSGRASLAPELAARPRLMAGGLTWGLYFLAGPGILARDGLAPLAILALVPWALSANRPGRRAFLCEWASACLGFIAICFWMRHVWIGTFLFIGPLPALYVAFGGVLLRRLAAHFPLALAVPAAWLSTETLRQVIEPPLGFGWMRLGVNLVDLPLVAGSARVWGVGGLSLVAAAAAGGLADCWRARARLRGLRRAIPLGVGCIPLALALLFGALSSPPATTEGPRILLVQPAVEQKRKQQPGTAEDLFAEACRLTYSGLQRAAARQEEVDLVAWGESMLPLKIIDPGVAEAYAEGARVVPWAQLELDADLIQLALDFEESWVGKGLFGQAGGRRLLPEGTSFLAGAEVYRPHAGALRRVNAVVLWDAAGRRRGEAGKVHLVPGAEQLCGLERWAWVRSLTFSIAGYVPDLLPEERTRVFELEARGRVYRFGATVCFDNTFDDPYTSPLREGPLDFHLIASNEAWYEKSFEMDQMVAFSRLVAIMTGRSVVRVTNSGVSALIGPDGRVLERLEVRGEDRAVPGTLAVSVPVPEPPMAGGAAPRMTPYVRAEKAWLAAWIALPLLLAALARARFRGGS